jgi:hypothetical protein
MDKFFKKEIQPGVDYRHLKPAISSRQFFIGAINLYRSPQIKKRRSITTFGQVIE